MPPQTLRLPTCHPTRNDKIWHNGKNLKCQHGMKWQKAIQDNDVAYFHVAYGESEFDSSSSILWPFGSDQSPAWVRACAVRRRMSAGAVDLLGLGFGR